MDKKVLECSSRGDRRFSALYVKVSVNGVVDSLENHYQKSKRRSDGSMCRKGERVSYMVINGKRLESKYLSMYYKLLWIKYLDNNLELIDVLKEYDDYNDMFKGRSINSQSDVIRDYMKYGRSIMLDSCKEFIEKIK